MSAGNKQATLHEQQLAFARAIRDPQNAALPNGVSERSMGVYHELFFNNFVSCLESAFPVIHEILPKTLMDELVKTFFRSHESHTPEFPRLPVEFLNWLAQRDVVFPEEPGFLYELALWEWTELEVALDEAKVHITPVTADNWQKATLQLNPTLRLLMFEYPVQQICKDFMPQQALAQPVYLAAFRTGDDSVEFMQLEPGSAVFLQLMQEYPEYNGARLLQQLLDSLGQPVSQAITDFASAFIEQLTDRQIIVSMALPE